MNLLRLSKIIKMKKKKMDKDKKEEEKPLELADDYKNKDDK